MFSPDCQMWVYELSVQAKTTSDHKNHDSANEMHLLKDRVCSCRSIPFQRRIFTSLSFIAVVDRFFEAPLYWCIRWIHLLSLIWHSLLHSFMWGVIVNFLQRWGTIRYYSSTRRMHLYTSHYASRAYRKTMGYSADIFTIYSTSEL